MVLILQVKVKQQRCAASCKLVECLGKGNRVCFSFITATTMETRGITVWLNRLLTVIYQDPGNPLLSIQAHLVFVHGGSRSVG